MCFYVVALYTYTYIVVILLIYFCFDCLVCYAASLLFSLRAFVVCLIVWCGVCCWGLLVYTIGS